MKTENFIIDVNVDIRKRSSQTLGITLMSQDINNYTFSLKLLQDGELIVMDDSYEVEVLSLFTTSKTSRLVKGTIRTHQVEWVFDTSYISKSEAVKNYVYVRKDGELLVSADANCFIFNVGLSEIDKGTGKVAETYDENYEKVLSDYSGALDERTTERLDEAVVDFNQRGDAEIDDWRTSADVELEDYLADRVVLKNLINNGDFSDGTTGWTITSSTVEDLESGISFTTNIRYGGVSKTILTSIYNGQKLYLFSRVRTESSGATFLNNSNPGVTVVRYTGGGDWQLLSFVNDQPINATRFRPEVRDESLSIFLPIEVEYIGAINLTATFGAGKEPSKEWMDRLVEQTGYFDEYMLDESWQVGEMLRLNDTKANKVQEDWITPTLLNGVTVNGDQPPQYYKDELGIVHFRGKFDSPTPFITAFILPVGYRPATESLVPVSAQKLFGLVSVRNNGYFIKQTRGELTEIDISAVEYRAEG